MKPLEVEEKEEYDTYNVSSRTGPSEMRKKNSRDSFVHHNEIIMNVSRERLGLLLPKYFSPSALADHILDGSCVTLSRSISEVGSSNRVD